jgi:hypothetical protein
MAQSIDVSHFLAGIPDFTALADVYSRWHIKSLTVRIDPGYPYDPTPVFTVVAYTPGVYSTPGSFLSLLNYNTKAVFNARVSALPSLTFTPCYDSGVQGPVLVTNVNNLIGSIAVYGFRPGTVTESATLSLVITADIDWYAPV